MELFEIVKLKCYGKNIPDPDFGTETACRGFAVPAQELQPHGGAGGLCFYTGSMFPKEYRNQIFIAEKGSSVYPHLPGKRITLARLKGNVVVSYEVFAEGWSKSPDDWGILSDVCVAPDGALLVSDASAGVIYRVVSEI